MHTIYTIGHSTRTIEQFIAFLKAHEISMVVDVRAIPRLHHRDIEIKGYAKVVEQVSSLVLMALRQRLFAGMAALSAAIPANKRWRRAERGAYQGQEKRLLRSPDIEIQQTFSRTNYVLYLS